MSTPTITFTPLPYGAVSQLDKETLRVNENYPEEETWYSRENVFCDILRGLVGFTEGDCSVRYHPHRRQIEVALLRDGELMAPTVEGYKALFWVAQQVQDAQHILRSLQDPQRPPLDVKRVVLKAHDPEAFKREIASLDV